MIPDIEINGQTLDQMTQEELSRIDAALGSVVRQTSTPCIEAAERFLTSIRQSYEDLAAANIIARHQNKLKKSMQNPDNDVTSLRDEYGRNKQILKEMYLRSQVVEVNMKLEEFSKELNTFLNQKTQLTYVYTNGRNKNPIVFLVDDLGQIMHKGMGSKGAGIKARIDMSRGKARQALQGGNSAIKRLAEQNYMTEKQIANLKGSYNQVVNRYNRHRYTAKGGANKAKVVHVILWRPDVDWKVVVMGNNAGDLKQAYVAALISRKGFISAEMEKNIDDYMAYVSQVDATPGMLQGDVSEMLNDGSSIEYAVKGARASYMSLQLGIKLAIDILSTDPPFDKAALEKKKAEYAKDVRPRNQQMTIDVLEDLFGKNIPNELEATIRL